MPSVSSAQQESAEQRQRRLAALYQQRLALLLQNYHNTYATLGQRQTFNQSLAAIRRTLNPRSRGKPPRRRLHHELELVINVFAMQAARARGPQGGAIVGEDVRAAGLRALEEFKPRRGRPGDHLLRYHVKALMVLYRQTCGKHLRSSRTKNSLYEPHLEPPSAAIYLPMFQKIDPTVTATRFANLVRDIHASGEIEGLRFDDLFPLTGRIISGRPEMASGFATERSGPLTPIYCS